MHADSASSGDQQETTQRRKPPSKASRLILCSVAAVAVMTVLGVAILRWHSTLEVTVGQKWSAAERISIDAISHDAWNLLLKKYVNDRGEVDYAAWLASSENVSRLESYLNQLSRADINQPAERSSKLAFWINTYNALTAYGILREYPTSSIRNHTSAVGYNIWKHILLRVGDETYSLDAIEHEILRKMDEPRIHFAIVCASVGCPRLLNEAYVASHLDKQLNGNARVFFAQDRNFRMDEATNTVYLSSIFDWFGSDFGEDSDAQLQAIAPYLPSDEARSYVESGNPEIEYLDYDWSLNKQPGT